MASLKAADFTITDLGGSDLAQNDGEDIWIDADAAGHGWSLGVGEVAPTKVDLLSTVTHEFGHILGYGHDVMDPNLAVGERDLPQVAQAPDMEISLVGNAPHMGAELLAG